MTLAAPPAPGNSIHLVLGDSAAGCVRAAGASFSMPGAVFGFSGELAHGPLDAEALCSPWRALVARLDLEQPEAVIVWGGNNVGDVIFVAMTLFRGQDDRFHFCHHLVMRHAGACVVQAGVQLGFEPSGVFLFLVFRLELRNQRGKDGIHVGTSANGVSRQSLLRASRALLACDRFLQDTKHRIQVFDRHLSRRRTAGANGKGQRRAEGPAKQPCQ